MKNLQETKLVIKQELEKYNAEIDTKVLELVAIKQVQDGDVILDRYEQIKNTKDYIDNFNKELGLKYNMIVSREKNLTNLKAQIYKNPEYLSKKEINIINSKFTNININSVNKKDNDYILFQQIKNSLKFIKNICKNYVISLLRNHLIKNKLDDKMYQLIMIKDLIIKIPSLSININNLIQYIRIMDDQNITKELFNIFKIIINHLMFYYNFNSSDIESLLYLMNNDSNKYNLLKYFNDFEEKFMN